MTPILSLAFMLFFSQAISADTPCNNDDNAEICVAVQSTELDCNTSSSSDYFSDCVATVMYEVTNHGNDIVEAKASCNVEINYLKSVMGIRDSGRQHNSQIHDLAANSRHSFAMPVEFMFSTQAEANNVEMKSVNCQID